MKASSKAKHLLMLAFSTVRGYAQAGLLFHPCPHHVEHLVVGFVSHDSSPTYP